MRAGDASRNRSNMEISVATYLIDIGLESGRFIQIKMPKASENYQNISSVKVEMGRTHSKSN